ncbi:hypothetical protein [Nostoc sp.]|uniref:hypothetical protein n=1 Tax=Nostoc sp. TaxID=1180 RepID=UPI002FFB7750
MVNLSDNANYQKLAAHLTHLRSQLNFHSFFKVTYTMDGCYRHQGRQQPNQQYLHPEKRGLKRVWA